MIYSFGVALKQNWVDYICYESVLDESELRRIIGWWDAAAAQRASVHNTDGAAYKDELRRSSVMFLSPNNENEWLYRKMAYIVNQTNAERFHFDLIGFFQELQLTEYGQGDFFDWHMDFGGGDISHRKVSITIQLSDPDEYEGGDLQFRLNQNVVDTPKAKGTVVLFPSFIPHRVTPITRGVRRSIVGWVSGVPYR